MRGAIHDTFREITIHTAKCDLCNRHNTSKIYRCEKCGRQCCLECWESKKGGDGRHNLHHKDSITYKGPKAEVLPPSLKVEKKDSSGEKRKVKLAEDGKRKVARKIDEVVLALDEDARLMRHQGKRTSDELTMDDEQLEQSFDTPLPRRARAQAERAIKKQRWESSTGDAGSEGEHDEDESEGSLTPYVSLHSPLLDFSDHGRSSQEEKTYQPRNDNLSSTSSKVTLPTTTTQASHQTTDHAGLNSIVLAVDMLETLDRTSHQQLSPVKGVFKTIHQGFTPINTNASASSTPTPPSKANTHNHRETPKMKTFTATSSRSTTPKIKSFTPTSAAFSSSSTLSPLESKSSNSTPRMKIFAPPNSPSNIIPKLKSPTPTSAASSSSSTLSPLTPVPSTSNNISTPKMKTFHTTSPTVSSPSLPAPSSRHRSHNSTVTNHLSSSSSHAVSTYLNSKSSPIAPSYPTTHKTANPMTHKPTTSSSPTKRNLSSPAKQKKQ
ncbi:MAG: hypothetical protein Q9222_004917, partial [Ikaeria aurantiellina]